MENSILADFFLGPSVGPSQIPYSLSLKQKSRATGPLTSPPTHSTPIGIGIGWSVGGSRMVLRVPTTSYFYSNSIVFQCFLKLPTPSPSQCYV